MTRKLSLREMLRLAGRIKTWERTQQISEERDGTDPIVGDNVYLGIYRYTEYTGSVNQISMVSAEEHKPASHLVYSLRCRLGEQGLGEIYCRHYDKEYARVKSLYDKIHSRRLRKEEKEERAEYRRKEGELSDKLKQIRKLLKTK